VNPLFGLTFTSLLVLEIRSFFYDLASFFTLNHNEAQIDCQE
jgi:hypothetical protein